MSDYSDAVASHVLVSRQEAARDKQDGLRFHPRAGWVGVLLFGSWGFLISVPMTAFLFSGELPLRTLPVSLGITALGYGLVYAAVRSVVNRARLEVVGAQLRFSMRPLWPHRARAWSTADIGKVTMPQRQPSLMHPARYKGYPMPQPHLVVLKLTDGRQVTLPITLGLQDAETVVRYVKSRL